MSLVTLDDKHRALQLIGGGSPAQDRLLLSLAQRTTWTHNQRALVEKLVRERLAWTADERGAHRPCRRRISNRVA